MINLNEVFHGEKHYKNIYVFLNELICSTKVVGSKNRGKDCQRQDRNELIVCSGKFQLEVYIHVIILLPGVNFQVSVGS